MIAHMHIRCKKTELKVHLSFRFSLQMHLQWDTETHLVTAGNTVSMHSDQNLAVDPGEAKGGLSAVGSSASGSKLKRAESSLPPCGDDKDWSFVC
jgi:hypothetical protein